MKTLDPVLHQIRKESLLQHARHLFATKGLAETSMDDIAHIAGMQKASLYHYFESKQKILQEMVDLERARCDEHLRSYRSGNDLRQTLQLIGRTFLQDMEDPARKEYFSIIHFESHKNPVILRALQLSPTSNCRGFYAVFERHLRERLAPERIALFVTQFMGALTHYVTVTKLRESKTCLAACTDEQYLEQLVDIFARWADPPTN